MEFLKKIFETGEGVPSTLRGEHAAAVINTLGKVCRREADKWYRDLKTGEKIQRNHGEQFALMHGEISEAMEGDRKNLMDSHLPHRKAVEVELADLFIRALDFAAENKLDVGGAIVEKLLYNRERKDHRTEERLKENGKKF